MADDPAPRAGADVRMDDLVSLCARRGFIFQSSEIYGGINGFWDYGPLGVELKQNLRALWWQRVVRERDDVEGIDSAIIATRAPGRRRATSSTSATRWSTAAPARAASAPTSSTTSSPARRARTAVHDFTTPRNFNLMLKTFVGASEDAAAVAYLRAETCQPIFNDFKRVREAARQKIPFGIAQIGKAFRNEINPRNFTFRSREFEQAELEFFVHPGEREKWFELLARGARALPPRDRLRRGPAARAARTSRRSWRTTPSAAADIEFKFPFGWQEIEGSPRPRRLGPLAPRRSSRARTSSSPTRRARSATCRW